MTTPRIVLPASFEAQFPGGSKLATEVVWNTMAWTTQLHALLQSWCKEFGIPSASAYSTLEMLRGEGAPLKQTEIAEKMMITRASATALIRTMLRHGLVERSSHPTDKRAHLVEISVSGVERLDALSARLHRLEREWVSVLTPEERRQMLDMLGRLQAITPMP